jgi:hypothetical protein
MKQIKEKIQKTKTANEKSTAKFKYEAKEEINTRKEELWEYHLNVEIV